MSPIRETRLAATILFAKRIAKLHQSSGFVAVQQGAEIAIFKSKEDSVDGAWAIATIWCPDKSDAAAVLRMLS